MRFYLGIGLLILSVACLIDLPLTKKVNRNLYGFFLMEGRLRLGGFVAAILSANLSIGNFLVFIAVWGYMFGWGGIFWFIVNLALNAVAYIVFMPAFRRYIEDCKNSGTIHEYLSSTFASSAEERAYAVKIRIVASATTIFGLLLAIVFEVHLAAIFLSPLLGVDTAILFVVLTVLIGVYSGVGGFHTLIWTDRVQAIALIFGTLAIIPIIRSLGSINQMIAVFPLSINTLNIGLPSIIGICVIGSGWFLVAMDQWQRTCATRNAKRTRVGMIWYLVSISGFAVIYGLMGMHDRASLLPALTPALKSLHSGGSNPLTDFFLIANIVPSIPPYLFALVAISFLAAAASTANTFLIVSGHSFVSDVLLSVYKKDSIHDLTEAQNRLFLIIARSTITGMGIFVIVAWVAFNMLGLLKDPLSFFFIAYSIQFALLAPMVFSRLPITWWPSARRIFNSIWIGVVVSIVFGLGFWAWSQMAGETLLWMTPLDWLSLTPVITFVAGLAILMSGRSSRGTA